MEDKIKFDVRGVIKIAEINEALVYFTLYQPEINKLELYKKIKGDEGSGVLIRGGLTWAECKIFKEETLTWLEAYYIVQEGWSKQDQNLLYCDKHDVFYGGVLGCHICNEFIE
jgi:hypothetical protein